MFQLSFFNKKTNPPNQGNSYNVFRNLFMKSQLWKCFQNNLSCCLVLNRQRFLECMTKVLRNKTKTLSLYCSLLILSRMFSVEYIICKLLSVRCLDSFLGAVIVYEYKKYFRISLYGVEVRQKQNWSETKQR